jgi:hypothetical protein
MMALPTDSKPRRRPIATGGAEALVDEDRCSSTLTTDGATIRCELPAFHLGAHDAQVPDDDWSDRIGWIG